MYKLLIVEDEVIEREALATLICEKFKDTLEVYSVENGYEGLKLYKKHKIDIVLSDINLPGINGLETIRMMKQIRNEAIFLILTSYNYFEYAQEAIRLGVQDFILKPVTGHTLHNMLLQIIDMRKSKASEKRQASQLVSKIEEIKPIIKSDCVHSIVQNKEITELKKLFLLLNMRPISCMCIVAKNEFVHLKMIKELADRFEELGYNSMYDNYYGLYILFIVGSTVSNEADIKVMNNLIHEYNLDYKYVGISKVHDRCENFHNAYLEAVDAIGKQINLQTQQKMVINPTTNYDIDEVCDQLIADFLRNDKKAIEKEVNRFYLYLLYFERKKIIRLLEEFNDKLLIAFNKKFKLTLDKKEYYMTINYENPYENLHEKLLDLMHVFTVHLESEELMGSNKLTKKALYYISLNYNKPITLNNVADYLGVSPFYVSRLLNTNLSKNFTDLVMEIRIEKAKEMLKDDKKIKEISSVLGFQSQSYFGKVFKKLTGYSPKEYAEQLMEENNL